VILRWTIPPRHSRVRIFLLRRAGDGKGPAVLGEVYLGFGGKG
jgi:hypothetical protein